MIGILSLTRMIPIECFERPVKAGRLWRLRACVLALAVGLVGCGSVSVTRPAASEAAASTPAPAVPVPTRLPRIGLALGGGAARGFAHVGVIQVLEKNGIRPDLVVGTSAGSVVAALYASGLDGKALEQMALSMEEATLTDWTLPFANRGMLKGQALARYISTQTQGKPIEAMALPLGIVATDLATGQGIVFRQGDTGTAVRASSSVPGVFQPVPISGREYVDGGLVAPVPVSQTLGMGAEFVVAVDISSPPTATAATDTLSVMLQTFAIMGQTINQHELKAAQVVVRPDLKGVGSAAFGERQRAMAAGRAAMEAALPQLKALLAARRIPLTQR